ncbi:MAG: hypothetical protein M3P49_02575 [Actinomycetota bacterium]|nr:hypothetical protein [Actinomycetota bacterium]
MAKPGTPQVQLGDNWWVLDNTLALYRGLGEKKGREVLLLRDLKASYPSFPEGAVLARETPDFVVESPEGPTVGLEFVEAYRGGRQRKGSLERERESNEETVLRLAEKLYYAEPGAPVYAYLTWPSLRERRGPLPRPVRELAGAVAGIVRAGAGAWEDGGRLEFGPPELRGTPLEGVVYWLSARSTGFVGEDGRDSAWGRSLSYAREVAGVGDLERAILAKDRVHEDCRKRCDEAWLVVALTGGPSSFDDVEDGVLGHRFLSLFRRVVVLCHNSRSGRRIIALRGHD